MADYNNNGKDDLVEVLEQARDQMQATRDKTLSRSINGDDYSRTHSQNTINTDMEKVKRVKKIIKTVIIIYILIQFAPMFIGGIIMAIGLVAEINSQIDAQKGTETILPLPDEVSPKDASDVLYQVEAIGENIQAWFEKTFLNKTTSIFVNSGSLALTVLAALVVGILLIIVLRAITTKKGLTDEEITTELRNRESLFEANTSTSVESETSISECTNTNSNTDNTAEEDIQADSDVPEL